MARNDGKASDKDCPGRLGSHVSDASIQLRQVIAALDGAIAATKRALTTLETALEHPLQQGVQAANNATDTLAEFRRKHRSGTPSKISIDPELRAFIVARLSTQTFVQKIADVKATFPPERQVSMSSLSRWWQANRDPLNLR